MEKEVNLGNWINGELKNPLKNKWIEKINPSNGRMLYKFASSDNDDVLLAINSSLSAFPNWSNMSPIKRGEMLFKFVNILNNDQALLAKCVSVETGKSIKNSQAEVQAAIAQGQFFASEGRRLYSSSLTSENNKKTVQSIRVPHGVVGLIVPANTPIANIAWKIFPALICGNAVILKASEDAPRLALMIAKLSKKAGLPNGVLNVIQGLGNIAGESLVRNKNIKCISFTGSTAVGKRVGEIVSARMGRCSLELGGINSIIVLKDANLDNAIHWSIQSAFSNAGQRCASASRILVQKDIFSKFTKKLVTASSKLKLGISNKDDIGPVINKRQFQVSKQHILDLLNEGGKTLLKKTTTPKKGFYIQPTLMTDVSHNSKLLKKEVFGPIATIHEFSNLSQAVKIANNTDFGLTAAVHSSDINKCLYFIHNLRAGTVNINSGTFGSEPHMPFGGFGSSGNGTREPGSQAIDVYTELKNYSFTEI